MEQMPQNTFEDNDNQRSVSRRELIKIIGAAGFAVAATALIPDRWLPPQIDIGVLPVHAQTSDALTISNLQFTPRQVAPAGTSARADGIVGDYLGNGLVSYNGRMDYLDPLRQTGMNASRVHLWTLANSQVPVSALIMNIIPEFALTGAVTFFTNSVSTNVNGLCAQLNTMGRLSNKLCEPVGN